MMKFLSLVALAIFGTVILLYSVVFYEPPAFIAYAFGILTACCWCGVSFLYWLRSDNDEDEGGDDINGSD